jgi:hypothetical protein
MFLVAALAAAPWTARAKPAAQAPTLTLFEGPAFQGAQVTYTGVETHPLRPGFRARSAISTGLWTLCETREAASHCQTVNGAAAHLKLQPGIVRPGVNAVALYDRPGLKGRKVIYSFASDRPPPFRPRSAKTWGGPWSLCASGSRGCQTVEGVRPRIDLDVAAAWPGRSPRRIQVALNPAPPPARPPPRPARGPPRAQPPAPVLVRNERRAPPAPPPQVQRVAQGPLVTNIPRPLPPLPTALPRSVEPLATDPRPAAARSGQAGKGASPQARQGGPSSIVYVCEDGRALTVQFDPRNATAVVRAEDEAPVVLGRASTRRGFRYEAWDRSFYGELTQATYQVRDDDPVDCWPARSGGRRVLERRAATLDEPPPDFR